MKGIKISDSISLKQGFDIPSGIVVISEVYVPLGIKERRIEDKSNAIIGIQVFANEDAITNGKQPLQTDKLPASFQVLIPDAAFEEQKSMEMLLGFIYKELNKVHPDKCEIVTL